MLVFVDDDNVLNVDYLQRASEIPEAWPQLGAWGGRIDPVFESPPPDWSRPFWNHLAIRDFKQDLWSNVPLRGDATPCGAGLCTRRTVALAYAKRLETDHAARKLDRRGNDLSSSGDTDFAWTAIDLGMGTGVFVALQLQHLIPASRLTEAYLSKLVEEITRSMVLVKAMRGVIPPMVDRPAWRDWLGRFKRRVTMAKRERLFLEAELRGLRRGIEEANTKFAPNQS